MTDKVYYEDHNSLMKTSPIIYHHDTVSNESKLRYLNMHENIEILFVTNGNGKVLNGKEIYSVQKDNVVIINGNQPHTVSSETRILYDCLIVNKNFLSENGIDNNSVKFSEYIKNDDKIAEIFDKLRDIYDNSHTYKIIEAKGTVLLLFAHLLDKYADNSKNCDESDNKMSFAVSYIMRNISKKLSLEEMSAMTGYSKYYFVRKFKELTGKTPVEFINIQRCEFAKILMINTENSITNIAFAVGYENPAYFTKVFTKTVSKTPSKFIQDNRRK